MPRFEETALWGFQHLTGRATILRWPLTISLVIAVFIADTTEDLRIPAAVLYAIIVLIAAAILRSRGVLVVATICMILTLVSFVLPLSRMHEAAASKYLLGLGTIIAVTYLTLTKSAAVRAHREAHAELVRNARICSLGELATSITHEVEQPLTGVINSGNAALRWLAAEPPNFSKARQAIERIIADANRASGIVERVRNLAKRGEPRAEWMNPVIIVDEIIALSQGELNHNRVSIRINAPAALPMVFADSVQIQQVLLNIILNAIDAMADTPPEHRQLSIDLSTSDGRCVEFCIADNGRGMSRDVTARLFDAFHSTKREGMGLGLAVSRAIIEAHGGRIWAGAASNRGSQLYFTLRGRQIEM